MFAWSAAWKGGDVIGVSDKGKTTSYVLPLVFSLSYKPNYSFLPAHGVGVSVSVLMADCSVIMLQLYCVRVWLDHV